MTIYSGLFNSVNGDRKYNAWWFAKYFSTFIGNGVFPNPSTNLQVIENENMKVTVKPGTGWINGYFIYSDNDYVLQHDLADGVLKRIDRVVMRLDYLKREIEIDIKKGQFSSNPVAPSLQRDPDMHELALADVLINNGVTQITQANITDVRLDSELCGIVHGVVDQVDTSTIFNQYQAWFNSITDGTEQEIADWQQQQYEDFMVWFQSIQDILDGDVAANLANRIANLETELSEHQAEKVHQGELHGFRLTDGKLEYFDGQEWQRVRGDGYPVGSVTNFSAKGEDKQIALTWEDPPDVTIEDSDGNLITIARWKGTKILRKTGSYPANENDGVLVVDNGVRDQYKSSGFTDKGLTNDTTYYYMAFPYTDEDIVTVDNTNRTEAVPSAYVVYGVKIDTNNSNPETAVTYTDDSTGFTPANGNNGNFQFGSWEDKFPFNKIKTCVFQNGGVNYYLDPNDYTKKSDGTTADITTGNDGDVMIEFPKIYWNLETIGTDIHVKYSDVQLDNSFKLLAHTRGGSEKDNIYIGAYLGYLTGGKLRSLSGKTVTASRNIGQFRNVAQANGEGYEQFPYYPLLMLQVLFLIMFKSRDSQTALGRGYVDGNNNYALTGGADGKGMFFGSANGSEQVKFCGVEDFWGNYYQFIDGMYSDNNYNMLIGNDDFNDTGNGYANYGKGATTNLPGYISEIQGGTETGFIIKTANGSETTHFADYGNLYAGRLPIFGGYRAAAGQAGAFLLTVYRTASSSLATHGARCCFLGT